MKKNEESHQRTKAKEQTTKLRHKICTVVYFASDSWNRKSHPFRNWWKNDFSSCLCFFFFLVLQRCSCWAHTERESRSMLWNDDALWYVRRNQFSFGFIVVKHRWSVVRYVNKTQCNKTRCATPDSWYF